MSRTKETNDIAGWMEKAIRIIERVGNKFPHPFWIFVALIAIIFTLSAILSFAGVSITYMQASRDPNLAPAEAVIQIKNLFNYETIRYLTANFVTTYSGFAPLGIVLIMMIGIGMAEQTGFLAALMRSVVMKVRPALITAVIAFVGINANLASDAGVVIVPALGAAIFKAMGRNPWVGIITGYAAANGGYGANMFIAATDALLAGITQSVTDSYGIIAPVNATMNWYFMMVATIVLTIVCSLVTERIIEKRLDSGNLQIDRTELEKHALTLAEKKGLRNAGIGTIVYTTLVLVLTLPKDSLFRNAEGGILPRSPLLSSIIFILFFLFVTVGACYGKTTGSIKSFSDVPKLMQKGISNILSFLVVALPASIFIYLFSESALDKLLAVSGGQLLETFNITGVPLLILFILFCTCINIFITSGTAKWLILAPIFVPMFSVVGFSPALTQIAYRVADSATNIISPIDYYVPVMLGLLETYRSDEDQKVGIGTLISNCFPYSVAFLISLVVLLAIWFIFKIPLGPGVPVML